MNPSKKATRGFDKLLVGVDGSDASLHALRESFRLSDGWITVVSVAPPYEGDLGLIGVRDLDALIRKPCENALSAAAQVAEAEGARIKTVCAQGTPHEQIVDVAEGEDCDLIVLGARGARSVGHSLIGCVTERVIGYSPIDVLVVPKRAEVDGWERILLPTDGSRYSKMAAEKALGLAAFHGSELQVVSVLDLPPEFYAEAPDIADDLARKAKAHVQEVKELAESSRVRVDCFIREGAAYKAITDLAEEQKASVIVMGSHGRTGLKRLLMGSVTEGVIGHAICPVLVVKA